MSILSPSRRRRPAIPDAWGYRPTTTRHLLASENEQALVVLCTRREVAQVSGAGREEVVDSPSLELALHVLGPKRKRSLTARVLPWVPSNRVTGSRSVICPQVPVALRRPSA
jgi:hypothetical protein